MGIVLAILWFLACGVIFGASAPTGFIVFGIGVPLAVMAAATLARGARVVGSRWEENAAWRRQHRSSWREPTILPSVRDDRRE
jgi:hypothetical protein